MRIESAIKEAVGKRNETSIGSPATLLNIKKWGTCLIEG
jgi:hypothetical protein